MNADQWQQFAAPVAPISVDNPDRVVIGDAKGRTSTLFPSGSPPAPRRSDRQLPAGRATRTRATSRISIASRRCGRRGWRRSRRRTHPARCPARRRPASVAICWGSRRERPTSSTLPGEGADARARANESFVADPAAVQALIARDVPLPTPANVGDRVRVRLLSGTGPIGSPNAVACAIVAAGGEVTIVGNADRFDYDDDADHLQRTISSRRRRRSFATRSASEQVSLSPTPNDIEDVTVILGQDATSKYGGNGG